MKDVAEQEQFVMPDVEPAETVLFIPKGNVSLDPIPSVVTRVYQKAVDLVYITRGGLIGTESVKHHDDPVLKEKPWQIEEAGGTWMHTNHRDRMAHLENAVKDCQASITKFKMDAARGGCKDYEQDIKSINGKLGSLTAQLNKLKK